jgi:phosphate transport system substrate-binding protein
MKKAILTASAAALALAASAGYAAARDQIQIVGSSTVFPFTTAVAERLGQGGQFKTPVVESTGTGGGMKLFCSGVGEKTPDFTNASRAIKDGELATCKSAGVTPVEIKVGFDGIVLANSKSGAAVDLTKEEIFKALAKNVAVDGKVVANPYKNWSDIDASLPATKIEVLGPPPTSGTRDAFVELVMDAACQEEVKAANEKGCGEIREDGAFVEAGENDNLIVQKLEANPKAVGIFGFSYLEENADRIKGLTMNGITPTYQTISDVTYPGARPLYIYVKKDHLNAIKGLKEFVAEWAKSWGRDGMLAKHGMVVSPDDVQAANAKAASEFTPLDPSQLK